MKITLLTEATKEYWPLLKIGAPNKLEYCLRHNIQFSMRRLEEPFSANVRDLPMKQTLDECDWVWFMGSDTLIMNHKIDVRQYLDNQYDFIIAQDINGINNDVFFLKNSAESYMFMNLVMLYNNTEANDQDSMVKAMKEIKNFKTKIVPQRAFNSYLYSEYSYPDDMGGNYTKGDFVLHLPGIPNERRIILMNEYLKLVDK